MDEFAIKKMKQYESGSYRLVTENADGTGLFIYKGESVILKRCKNGYWKDPETGQCVPKDQLQGTTQPSKKPKQEQTESQPKVEKPPKEFKEKLKGLNGDFQNLVTHDDHANDYESWIDDCFKDINRFYNLKDYKENGYYQEEARASAEGLRDYAKDRGSKELEDKAQKILDDINSRWDSYWKVEMANRKNNSKNEVHEHGNRRDD